MQSTFNIDQQCINTLRCLSIDGVQAANSGHPGLPLGLAPTAYALWKDRLRFCSLDPTWLNRDRFVLSAGHGSMLLYSLLHLFGYKMPLDELKNFRQLGSKTPGHPEYEPKLGIEVTTGPLGQGLANAVGMAIAAKYLKAYFNTEDCQLLDYNIYVLASDGDMQEGVAAEACSLAGHLQLDNLFVLYDNNHISIDGQTNLSFSEQVVKRFEAYGFETHSVAGNGNDLKQIQQALGQLKNGGRPSLLSIETIIGFGSAKFQNTAKAHGAPLGLEEVKNTKTFLGQPPDQTFYVSAEVQQHFKQLQQQKQLEYEAWQQTWLDYQKKHPQKATELTNWQQGNLGTDWLKKLPQFENGEMATRSASGKVLDAIMPHLPQMLAGSADLTPSNNTLFATAEDFSATNPKGRYVRYGIREHAMAAILNGIAQSQLLRAYAGTFLCFADYMRPSIRLAALSDYPSIFVFTHDSIGLGEDGPTHQPVEHLASLRAMPNLLVLRPADANETVQSWRYILEHPQPCVLVLTRQNLPVLNWQPKVDKGAYVLVNTPNADCLLLASGSEVHLAVEAQASLLEQGVKASVISFPCWELFEQQSAAYKQSVLPDSIQRRVVIEAGVQQGWEKYMGNQGKFIGMQGFGASAPYQQLYQHFGLTKTAVVEAALSLF